MDKKIFNLVLGFAVVMLFLVLTIFLLYSFDERVHDKNVLLNQKESQLVECRAEKQELLFDVRRASESEKKYLLEKVGLSNELNILQSSYNNLNTHFFNCFMANYCLYYPNDCLAFLGKSGNAGELALIYSDWCDDSLEDWERLMSLDSELN